MLKTPPVWNERKSILLVLGVAIVVRIIFTIIYYFTPEWNHLLVDSLFHDRWAVEISNGNVLGSEPFFRAPFYIYLLAGIYSIFGHSLLAARAFGHLIGLGSVLLTYLIAHRLFSKREAIVAGLIHALFPIAIFFESELLVESLFTLLVELSILLLFYSVDRKRNILFFLTGIVLGLAAITRPVILPLIPLYIIWIFLLIRERKKALIWGLLCATGAVLAIMPVTARNFLVGHDFVPIASSGGINFYIGNNEMADGLSAAIPTFGSNWQIQDIKYLAESETGHAMKASELSDFWYKKGIDWILNDKLDFLRLYLKKLYYCFNNFEISNNRDIGLFFESNPVLRYNPLNFALIFSLSIIGLLIGAGRIRLREETLFVLVFTAGYLMMISLFFINSRFRLPVVPYLIVFASAGLTGLVSLFRGQTNKLKICVVILAGLAIYLFSVSNFFHAQKNNTSNGLFNQANYLFSTGDMDKAISLYHRVLNEDGSYPKANLNLGALYLKRGNLDSAGFYFRQEINLYPKDALAYSNLASLYYLKNELPKSVENADRAISLMPYLPDGYLVKMRTLAALADTSGVINVIDKAQKALGNQPKILLDAGLIFSNWTAYDKAGEYLRAVLDCKPNAIETNDEAFNSRDYGRELAGIKARAAYQLGYIYGISNNYQESIKMSNMAITFDSSLVEAYINLYNGYLLSGDAEKARAFLRLAVQRFPENKLLKMLEEKRK